MEPLWLKRSQYVIIYVHLYVVEIWNWDDRLGIIYIYSEHIKDTLSDACD